MKAREQAAEYHFLEEQAKDSLRAARQLRQVEEAVHGECLESFMAHRAPGAQFGQPMFTDLTTRLRNLETQRKDLLGGAPYEVLMPSATARDAPKRCQLGRRNAAKCAAKRI